MSEQLTFLPAVGKTIQARFESFHRLNPWVYERLVILARQMKARGLKRMGINCLWEVVRWHYYQSATDPTSAYHLNDHYPSRFARLIMAKEPDLRDYFTTRKLRTH